MRQRELHGLHLKRITPQKSYMTDFPLAAQAPRLHLKMPSCTYPDSGFFCACSRLSPQDQSSTVGRHDALDRGGLLTQQQGRRKCHRSLQQARQRSEKASFWNTSRCADTSRRADSNFIPGQFQRWKGSRSQAFGKLQLSHNPALAELNSSPQGIECLFANQARSPSAVRIQSAMAVPT